MRRIAVVNLSNFDRIFDVFRKNGILIFLVVSFIAGLFIGVFSAENIDVFENVVTDYLMVGEIPKTGFLSSLFDYYFNILLIICICFICGTSMFGVLLSPLCVISFSFFYGIFSANIYSGYGLKGIAYYAVMILPGTILLTISLLFAALESFKFSFFIIKQFFQTSPPLNISLVFKDFCFKYLLICLLAFVSALVSALLALNFSDKFTIF